MKRISSGRKFRPPKMSRAQADKENRTLNHENSPGEAYEHRMRNVESLLKKKQKKKSLSPTISANKSKESPNKREGNSIDRLVRENIKKNMIKETIRKESEERESYLAH